jgi:hypothetical protein
VCSSDLKKWNVPADTPIEKGYQVPLRAEDESKLYFRLPPADQDGNLTATKPAKPRKGKKATVPA